MTIAEIIASRGLTEVLHFTTNRGIVGTLASKALLSRYRLPEEKYLQHVLHVNSAVRREASAFFDKSENWLDYVNLSLSEINFRYMTVSRRWHDGEAGIWWGILAFDAAIMTHERVAFATTNNSYDLCVRQRGAEGLEALFENIIPRKHGWSVARKNRPQQLPTCEQAEVLYPERVPVEFLRTIYVEHEDHHDQVAGWLSEFGIVDVNVIISPQKFRGSPN